MNEAGDWVKDGSNLFLWVPVQHRASIKKGLKLIIVREEGRKPEVDVARLFAYSGSRWADLYRAFSET